MSENTNPILYPNWNDRSSKEILKPWRSKSIYSKYFTYWGTVLSPPPLSWASVRLQSWISISVLLTRTSLPWAALDLGSGEHTVLARLFVCGTQAMFSVCFNKWQSRNVSLSNMGGKNSYLLGRGWDGWTATISHQSEWLRSKSLQVINAGEGVEKREPSYTADGHLGCFHVLAIINSAAMNIGVHVSLLILVSSVYMPSSGIAGSCCCYCCCYCCC